MKKAWEDVKSFVTVLFAFTLVALLFIAIFRSDDIFQSVFLLFTNLCTAVFTYFFTKKKEVSENATDTKEININQQNDSK